MMERTKNKEEDLEPLRKKASRRPREVRKKMEEGVVVWSHRV